MAQYQHLPIYKVTYDLLVKTAEVTRLPLHPLSLTW